MATAIRETGAILSIQAVQAALDAGELAVDVYDVAAPHTCHHRLMYAKCPHGHVGAIYPAQRDGVRISALKMHCPTCNADYEATAEDVTVAPR